jgi:hypothetical protein
MTNLLRETTNAIANSGHVIEDVVFIGSLNGEYRCTWDEFTILADVEYSSGYGAAEVATDLIVRFSDGKKMWRGEYDGSEWWEFDAPLVVDYTKPGRHITKLIGGMWRSVAQLHDADE